MLLRRQSIKGNLLFEILHCCYFIQSLFKVYFGFYWEPAEILLRFCWDSSKILRRIYQYRMIQRHQWLLMSWRSWSFHLQHSKLVRFRVLNEHAGRKKLYFENWHNPWYGILTRFEHLYGHDGLKTISYHLK